jgi:CRISPR-associated endonuclease Csn1
VKTKDGKFVLDENKEKIIKIAQGDTVRSTLFKDTFVAKIKDVERFEDGQPIRENGDWKYKKGKDEFIFTVRKPIAEVISKVDDIIDPIIREIVRVQKENSIDPQGKKIRHVRIKTKAGREVKERNKYYAAADAIPYAIILTEISEGKVDRVMIPIASFELSKFYKETGSFNVNDFVLKKYPKFKDYNDKRLLKVGQKIIVLKNDNEFEKRSELAFQTNRLYKITQFKYDGSKIMLQYHLTAQSKTEIDEQVKLMKDAIVRKKELELDIPIIMVNFDHYNITCWCFSNAF